MWDSIKITIFRPKQLNPGNLRFIIELIKELKLIMPQLPG
jgi:hypothetical protein